jgi:hypothetical protein
MVVCKHSMTYYVCYNVSGIPSSRPLSKERAAGCLRRCVCVCVRARARRTHEQLSLTHTHTSLLSLSSLSLISHLSLSLIFDNTSFQVEAYNGLSVKYVGGHMPGTQFACFTSTKVQILTSEERVAELHILSDAEGDDTVQGKMSSKMSSKMR